MNCFKFVFLVKDSIICPRRHQAAIVETQTIQRDQTKVFCRIPYSDEVFSRWVTCHVLSKSLRFLILGIPFLHFMLILSTRQHISSALERFVQHGTFLPFSGSQRAIQKDLSSKAVLQSNFNRSIYCHRFSSFKTKMIRKALYAAKKVAERAAGSGLAGGLARSLRLQWDCRACSSCERFTAPSFAFYYVTPEDTVHNICFR